jgi:hypothetical protein
LPRLSGKILATAGHHTGIQTRGCKLSLGLVMMSGVPLATCSAFNKLWNNKFHYKAASCWYFYRIQTPYTVTLSDTISKFRTVAMFVTTVLKNRPTSRL